MKKYCVMLRGENFNIEESDIVGFYTSRWVKAENPDQAEIAAVKLVKEDSNLMNRITNGKDNPPMIYLEDLFEVTWLTFLRRNPGAGYSFFSDESPVTANK